MPYNIENNNISFIIAFNNDTNYLLFYFYNFNVNEEINEPKVIIFNNTNIQNKMIRCQINSNSTYIICFYYSIINSKNYFCSQTFRIKDMDLIEDRSTRILEDENLDVIKQIKISNSLNEIIIFVNKINFLYVFQMIQILFALLMIIHMIYLTSKKLVARVKETTLIDIKFFILKILIISCLFLYSN